MGKIVKNGIAYSSSGSEGKSAYQTWLDLGNTGTEQDFLDSLGKEIDWSETLVTYVSISDLNTRKGLSISLVANEDNTQKIIDALDVKEQFVEWFGNSNNRFGINPKTYGDRINELRIIKTTETNAIITAIMNSGAVLSRLYTGGSLGDWTSTGHILSDGYMDDGTISITGTSEDSSGMYGNGVLPETLGFSRDAMTWANGCYRISNMTDLVGLPDNLQLGRLEHFNLKRWKGNHNPHTKDWAERMSVFYSDNGNIYTRLQISGATAGVVTSDTGWQQIATTPITELTDLGLDGTATIQNVMDKMTIGQHCIINTSRFDDKTEVNNIEYGKVEIRRLSSGMWSLWLEDVLHGDVVAHGTCSASKFAGWHYLATTDYVDSKLGKESINDSIVSTTDVWSSSKTKSYVDSFHSEYTSVTYNKTVDTGWKMHNITNGDVSRLLLISKYDNTNTSNELYYIVGVYANTKVSQVNKTKITSSGENTCRATYELGVSSTGTLTIKNTSDNNTYKVWFKLIKP